MSDRVIVPARSGRAVRAAAGQRVRIIDLEGGQVADAFAYCDPDAGEYLSAEHTRVATRRLFPRVGEDWVTNARRPILRFERDATPGIHDMLCAACDPARYAMLGVEGWHASCQQNARRAMAEHGHEDVLVPQPVNFFMNSPVEDDEAIAFYPSPTSAGDHVDLRALLDCIVCVSACPMDVTPINANGPTGLAIEID